MLLHVLHKLECILCLALICLLAVAPYSVLLSLLLCCATVDGQNGRAVLAACAARRWLARNAADVKLIHSYADRQASEWTSLFCCLPALEDVMLTFDGMLTRDDLECLLEALAGCPHLSALDLSTVYFEDEGLQRPFPDASTFAKLSSLTKLALRVMFEADVMTLTDVVGALVPLTGLADLSLGLPQSAVVPAALGQFKGLQSLAFYDLRPCVLEAGCLDLPKLQSLEFGQCLFEEDAQVLPGITALQCLTCIEFSGFLGSCFFDPGLSRLQLQRMVMSHDPCDDYDDDSPWLLRLPADMGVLSSSLLYLDLSGLELTRFPLALTQLVAIKFLDASRNEFAELPAGLTTLSRLTELRLGRVIVHEDPLQLQVKRPLDVRALGDLSGFPALCKLTFDFCEVNLSHNVLGAVRHASLVSLCFCSAHPAPECALVALQLVQELRRLGRGSVVRFVNSMLVYVDRALQAAQGRAPCQKFAAALEACGL